MQRHQDLLLSLLPQDCSTVGNQTLQQQFTEACKAQGLAATETGFQVAREALLAAGLVLKGRGRGGATARAKGATGEARPDFALAAQAAPAASPDLAHGQQQPKAAAANKPIAPPAPLLPPEPQVISYRHPDRRVNNPEVGLVNQASDPEQPKTVWALSLIHI